MPRIKDLAICIRHIDWSETSQIVVMLSEEHGKVRGLAKGSKRNSPSHMQRFSGGIELLTLGQVVAMLKRTEALATLTEWDLREDYYRVRHNLERQRAALYAADLCDALLAEQDPHPRTFAALRQCLEALDSGEAVEHALLRLQWQVLADAGYEPQLQRDVRRDVLLGDSATYTFDARAGGLTADAGITDWRVRAGTVELLRRLRDQGVEADHVDADAARRANRLLCVYARAILDKQLPTMKYVLGSES